MTRYDMVLRGGEVVTAVSRTRADLGIGDGRIAAIGPDLAGPSSGELDVHGCLVLPGMVDAHVHFNEPGRTEWEGWARGSTALAAGGGTTAIEMPLNAQPPTLTREAFGLKVAAAVARSQVDFALWGGLTPTNLDYLQDLAEAGVVGLKAFMSSSGTDDFQHADDDTLFHGMEISASLGLPVAVHAENDTITARRAARAIATGQTGIRDYLASRPVVAELEAIGRALVLARETGAALHVVHVSTGRGVAMVAAARTDGLDVTCETCPHYLVFTDEDAERIGALAKCAPPLRDSATREHLWAALLRGQIDTIGSDHSPAPPSMKTSDNAFATWGGISGCQHGLPALLSAADTRNLDMRRVVAMTSTHPARRFRLGAKGSLAIGADADLCVVRPQPAQPIPGEAVHYRHPRSAWDDHPMTWRVEHTILRGRPIIRDGQLTSPPTGRLLRPDLYTS